MNIYIFIFILSVFAISANSQEIDTNPVIYYERLFTLDTSLIINELIKDNSIHALIGANNKLWFGTDQGIFTINTELPQLSIQKLNTIPKEPISRFFYLHKNIYALDYLNTIYKFSNDISIPPKSIVLTEQNLPLNESTIINHIEDYKGNLLIVTDKHLYISDMNTAKKINISTSTKKYKSIFDKIKGNIKHATFFQNRLYIIFQDGLIVTDSNYKIQFISNKKSFFSIDLFFVLNQVLYAITYSSDIAINQFVFNFDNKLELTPIRLPKKFSLQRINPFVITKDFGILIGKQNGIKNYNIDTSKNQLYHIQRFNTQSLKGGLVYQIALPNNKTIFTTTYYQSEGIAFLQKLVLKKKNDFFLKKRAIKKAFKNDKEFVLNWSFEADTFTIKNTPKEEAIFEYLTELICQDTSLISINIEAHTSRARDSLGNYIQRGTIPYLKKLSQKRAEAVCIRLKNRIKQCYPNLPIQAIGYGDTHPLHKGDTETLEKLNRRVILKFKRKDQKNKD